MKVTYFKKSLLQLALTFSVYAHKRTERFVTLLSVLIVLFATPMAHAGSWNYPIGNPGYAYPSTKLVSGWADDGWAISMYSGGQTYFSAYGGHVNLTISDVQIVAGRVRATIDVTTMSGTSLAWESPTGPQGTSLAFGSSTTCQVDFGSASGSLTFEFGDWSGGGALLWDDAYPVTTTTLTSVTFQSFTYNGVPQTTSVSSVDPTGATYTNGGGTWSATNAGTYSATITGSGSYTGTVSADWTINKATSPGVSITPNAQTINVGDSVTFTALGSGSGAYVWGSSASGSGSTKTVTFPSAGVYTVSVQDPGNSNWNASNVAGATITVNTPAIPTTFNFGNLTHTYDGSTKTATVSPTPGGASYSSDLTRGPNAGTYTVSASANFPYAGTDSATLTINKANQAALAAVATPNPVQFGDSAVLSSTGGNGAGLVTFTYVSGSGSISGSTLTATGSSGSVLVNASKAGDTNYNPATSPNATVTLTRRTITVTATSGAKNYDGTTASIANPTVTSGSLRSGDTISFSGNTTTIPAAVGTTATLVGTATIRDSGSVDVTSHYQITSVNGSYSVSLANQAPLSAIATPSTLQYGESATLSTSGGSTGGTVTYNFVSGSASLVGSTLTATGSSGTAVFTATMAGNANYNAVTSGSTSVTLTKRAITITAPSGSKAWDGTGASLANPSLTSGTLRAGDVISVSGNTTSIGAAAGTTPVFVGTVTIRDSGSVDVTSHYQITSVNGSYTITATPPNLTISGTYNFGSVKTSVGSPLTSSQVITLNNLGQATLVVSSIAMTGDYTLIQVNGGAPTVPFNIAAGTSKTITISFNATTGGTRPGSFQINNNSSNSPNLLTALTGVGIDGAITSSWGPIR